MTGALSMDPVEMTREQRIEAAAIIMRDAVEEMQTAQRVERPMAVAS